MSSLSPPVAPTSQLSCYQVQALEREMAALKQRLAETSRELQRLRATITKASHAIQAALQVREHLLVVSVAEICGMPTDLSMRVSSTSFTKCGANTVRIMCIYHTHTHTQPVTSESDQLAQRGSLLSTLLELLNLASQPQAAQSQPMPVFQYQPGDLGIVPAKGQVHKSPVRTHPTELRSGGAGTQLPPLASAGSPLTGSRVR